MRAQLSVRHLLSRSGRCSVSLSTPPTATIQGAVEDLGSALDKRPAMPYLIPLRAYQPHGDAGTHFSALNTKCGLYPISHPSRGFALFWQVSGLEPVLPRYW